MANRWQDFFSDKPLLRRMVFFFPVQLFLVQLKKNHLLIFYWLLLFGFIFQKIAASYGIPYLFLNPEYLGKVNFLSFFIVGFALGGLIMAFNISSYMMNAFRFPFLATLSNPFPKFCLNNSLIPASLILAYSYKIFYFQVKSQFLPPANALLMVCGLWLGIALFIFLGLTYFFRTNKDLFKLFSVKTVDQDDAKRVYSKVVMKQNMKWRSLNISERDWYVEVYLSSPLRLKLARSYAHYDKDMLLKVFKQNHSNAAIFEIVVLISLIVFGLFRDFPGFSIPAGASLMLIITMYLMATSAVYNYLRGWSKTIFYFLAIVINFSFALSMFNVKNSAYGLDYSHRTRYHSSWADSTGNSYSSCHPDIINTLNILENWKKKNTPAGADSSYRPPMVLINASGGGIRAALWTFYSMQMLDSISEGALMRHTFMITGASGGMLGAAYFRELELMRQNHSGNNIYNLHYLNKISDDLLNPLVFAMTVNDLFLRFQKVNYGGRLYKKDRAWSFEEKFHQNTGYVLEKNLGDYAEPERLSKIPMMVFSPSILNDGRKLFISSQPVNYLCAAIDSSFDGSRMMADGVDYARLLGSHEPGKTRFSSVLRMSATFPVIMPTVSLPTYPEIEIADAGGRDNYGFETSARFLHVFREWISNNTSGVVILQIRDKYFRKTDTSKGNPTLYDAIAGPIGSLYNNLFVTQDFTNDALMRYVKTGLGCPLEVVRMELRNEKPDRISLSWHLTRKEKMKVISSMIFPDNYHAMMKVKEVLQSSAPKVHSSEKQ